MPTLPRVLAAFVLRSSDDFCIGDSHHQFAVRLKEIEFSELGPRRPLKRFEYLIVHRPSKAPDCKEGHFDVAVRVAVALAKDLLADIGVDREFLGEFAVKGRLQVLAIFDLASGEFPLQPVRVGVMALADQDLVSIDDDAGADENGFLSDHK